ncbi:MAG: hypothetical protein WA434_04265 [Candidatus Acidiferrales bacterium]
MKHALQFGFAAGVLLVSSLLCWPAQAQHMGASVARSMAIQPRATYSRRFVPRPIGSLPHRANHAVPNAFNATGFAGSGLTLQQLLDPVPPPGFDYQYLSAIDSDLAVKALIDPVTEWRVAEAERALRLGGGFADSSFYLLDGGGYYLPEESEQADQSQPQPSQQPQIIVLQQAPPTQPAAQPAPEAEARPAAAPVPDVGQFILVLRNGTRIQAVAFTSSNGNIVYITADGSRRTIALADLDSETTMRVNEERGTPLQLPL